jgi:predicted nucleic acid-binding Zn ribbon protein
LDKQLCSYTQNLTGGSPHVQQPDAAGTRRNVYVHKALVRSFVCVSNRMCVEPSPNVKGLERRRRGWTILALFIIIIIIIIIIILDLIFKCAFFSDVKCRSVV